MREDLRIERVSPDVAAARGLLPGIERIFFATSASDFAPGPEREAFRERWLGRYLVGEPCVLIVGLAAGDLVWGYLVGTLETASESPRFADLAYLREEFAAACRAYPAHLHINLDAAYRNRGLGARLITAFAEHARSHGIAGIHVVTERGMRNTRFYARCGFTEVAGATRSGRDLVFLGRNV